jgi:hypothetical protein
LIDWNAGCKVIKQFLLKKCSVLISKNQCIFKNDTCTINSIVKYLHCKHFIKQQFQNQNVDFIMFSPSYLYQIHQTYFNNVQNIKILLLQTNIFYRIRIEADSLDFKIIQPFLLKVSFSKFDEPHSSKIGVNV